MSEATEPAQQLLLREFFPRVRAALLLGNRLPAGFVVMILLVITVEHHLANHHARFSTVWTQAWRLSRESATRVAPSYEVLCFGDSLVMHGIVPQIVAQASGKRTYNLAVCYGQAPTSYFLFRRALAAGARPQAVFLDAELLEDDPLDSRQLWPELASFGECIELAVEGRDATFLATMALAKLLPSYGDRYGIRTELMAAFRGDTETSLSRLRAYRRNRAQNLGSHVMPATSLADSNGPDIGLPAEYRPKPWSCHALNARYLVKFLELAESQSIPVFWLLPPIHPVLQAAWDNEGRHGHLMALLEELQARFPHMAVVDGRHAGYRPGLLVDLTHLNRRGACAFSSGVGRVLRASLASGRDRRAPWIRLPRYRDMATAEQVEDIDQSFLAIREGRPRR